MAKKLRRFVSRRRMESGIINAVGVWFYCQQTNRYLYLLRNDPKHPFSWGLPGGKVESNENLFDAIKRECYEELKFLFANKKVIPIEKFTSADQAFCYHTFFCTLDEEFIPELNDEHLGYCWVDVGINPVPLHPGLRTTLKLKEVLKKINLLQNN